MQLDEIDVGLDNCRDRLRALAARYPAANATTYTEATATDAAAGEIEALLDPIESPATWALVRRARPLTVRYGQYAVATMALAECIEYETQSPGLADHIHEILDRVPLEQSVQELGEAISRLEAAAGS